LAGFSFKRFHVGHDLCGMKVGTDGVLLGAWADCCHAKQILDIGTGSGLIALMLAQRSGPESRLLTVDIDAGACQQAAENFQHSPWSERLGVTHCDVLQHSIAQRFDLIVSNPPYFVPGPEIDCQQRTQARYAHQLTAEKLLQVSKQLLTDDGSIALVLPYANAQALLPLLPELGLRVWRRCDVVTKPGKPAHRMLLQLSQQARQQQTELLEVHGGDGGYSEQFVRLTREFYLRM